MAATDLGRIASHYYVKYETIEMLNAGVGNVRLTQLMTDDNVLMLIANATEFSQIKVSGVILREAILEVEMKGDKGI